MLKILREEGNTVDLDETAHYSSRSAVFANSAIVVFGTLKVNCLVPSALCTL